MHFSVITSGISLEGAGLRRQAAVARLSIHTLYWIMMTMAKQQLLHDQRGSPSQSPLVYCVTHWLIEKEIGKKKVSPTLWNSYHLTPWITKALITVTWLEQGCFPANEKKTSNGSLWNIWYFYQWKLPLPHWYVATTLRPAFFSRIPVDFVVFVFFYTSSYFCRFEDSKNNLHATCSPWMDSRHTYSKAWEPRVAKCCNFKNNAWAGKKNLQPGLGLNEISKFNTGSAAMLSQFHKMFSDMHYICLSCGLHWLISNTWIIICAAVRCFACFSP